MKKSLYKQASRQLFVINQLVHNLSLTGIEQLEDYEEFDKQLEDIQKAIEKAKEYADERF